MDDLNFEFAPTGGGDVTGLNDPVTTTFKGNISWTLARESIQNIIDAHDPNSSLPARALYQLEQMKATDLPKLNQLNEILTACRDHNRRDPDAYKFYEAAIYKIQHDSFIKILKVSDYNTVGLTGADDDESGNYFSLMKAVGSTSKSETEGGSFGLGKGAYYAASSFRTIFVSSVYENDKHVFQGKSRLVSFKKDDIWMQGNGSYGLKGQRPVREKRFIPFHFQRDDRGTDIYIIGFEDDKWEQQMVKSVLNFFWYSILQEVVEITVGNTTISSDNLETLLEKYFDKEQADKDDEPNPWPYYLAYTDINHKIYQEKLENLGKVQLFLLQNDNYPKKVAYIRKTGMLIQKKGFGSINAYAGLFVCDDEDGNKILRKMENSKHDEWKSNNATESDLFAAAKGAEKELRDFVGNAVRGMTVKEDAASARVGGLEEYLYLKGDELGDTTQGVSGKPIDGISPHETPPEIGGKRDEIIDMTSVIRKPEVVAREVTKGLIEPGGSPIIKDKEGTRRKIGEGKEGEGEKDIVILKNVKYRTFAVRNSKNEINHILIIKGSPNTHFSVELKAGTDDAFDTVNIVKAEDIEGKEYSFDENFIQGLTINASGRLKLNVKFDTNDRYSLNLTAYENK